MQSMHAWVNWCSRRLLVVAMVSLATTMTCISARGQVISQAVGGVSIDADEYRAGFKRGTLKSFPSTMQFVSDDRATFAGVPSYELMVAGTLQNAPVIPYAVELLDTRIARDVGLPPRPVILVELGGLHERLPDDW